MKQGVYISEERANLFRMNVKRILEWLDITQIQLAEKSGLTAHTMGYLLTKKEMCKQRIRKITFNGVMFALRELILDEFDMFNYEADAVAEIWEIYNRILK